MEFLFILISFAVLVSVVEILHSKAKAKIVVLHPPLKEESCPPHRWQYVQSEDGTTKMVCAVCGPIKNTY